MDGGVRGIGVNVGDSIRKGNSGGAGRRIDFLGRGDEGSEVTGERGV